MIVVAALIIPLCILGLTTYKVSYNDRDFAPASVESVTGYGAADKHYPKSWLNNDIVYIKSDHDMRNTTDMISLDRIAKAIIRTPGVALVQSVTRPNGRPLEHASLPYAFGSTGTKIGENIGFLRDRVADIDNWRPTPAASSRDQQIGGIDSPTLRRHPHIARIRRPIKDSQRGSPRSPRRLRRFHAAYPQLLQLGATLLRHPDLLGLSLTAGHGRQRRRITNEFGNTVKGLAIIDTVTPQIIDQIQAS